MLIIRLRALRCLRQMNRCRLAVGSQSRPKDLLLSLYAESNVQVRTGTGASHFEGSCGSRGHEPFQFHQEGIGAYRRAPEYARASKPTPAKRTAAQIVRELRDAR